MNYQVFCSDIVGGTQNILLLAGYHRDTWSLLHVYQLLILTNFSIEDTVSTLSHHAGILSPTQVIVFSLGDWGSYETGTKIEVCLKKGDSDCQLHLGDLTMDTRQAHFPTFVPSNIYNT